ncbi:two-component regulator propeller domain-containing protein [uncultured Bacteroides sp.]|uniref:hybrid sensor histidine kinase/response regulator transcription factor n=1 Tax=uncultured Bacteroides sp. TaxID=162156 RepID=UPI002AA64BD0|nr:two-component regulator propeller domain-containing protein [uncultured Bacteroides sp.]
MKARRVFIFAFTVLYLLIYSQPLLSQKEGFPLSFAQLSTAQGLPTNEVHCIYQDKQGFIWIGTNSGLCQYDGVQMKVYKSNFHSPELLSNNYIRCIVEDDQQQLWIGTNDGITILDKRTGIIKRLALQNFKNVVVTHILITSNKRYLIGTEQGLYEYFPANHQLINRNKLCTKGIYNTISVMSLMEDSRKNVWIGTWNTGYYRLNLHTNQFFSYPQLNSKNSAFSIFEDSKHRIWIGSWGNGLFLLENPYNPQQTKWTNFNASGAKGAICSNSIYDIGEDRNTHKVWLATRNGLSIIQETGKQISFQNYSPNNTATSISYNDISSILCDGEGMMWLGTQGGGVNTTVTQSSPFTYHKIENEKSSFSSIRCLFADNKGIIWMGLGSAGFYQYNRITGTYTHNSQLPDFKALNEIPTVNAIVQSKRDGSILIGTHGSGLIVYHPNKTDGPRIQTYNQQNLNTLPHGCVFSLMEDKACNYWLGTKGGLCILTPKGQSIGFSRTKVDNVSLNTFAIVSMIQRSSGEVWLGTSNGGILKAVGNLNQLNNLRFVNYIPQKKNLNSVSTLCLFEDSKKRLWAGTDGGGLSLYDDKKDSFIPVHEMLNLPGDAIFSIQEDKLHNLWMSSNAGLIKLTVPENLEKASYRLYTKYDGLQDNLFNRNSSFVTKNGEMFFGGNMGFNSFYPEKVTEKEYFPSFVIKDIKLLNVSWGSLSEDVRYKISEVAPSYANEIQLNYKQNDFSIEFATLGFTASPSFKYAYKLKGYDSKWQYTEKQNFAHYNSLPAGTYTFQLRSTNANGIWNKEIKTLKIRILPPPWETWWAYCIYAIIIIAVAYMVSKNLRKRIQERNNAQLKELERVKTEELHHSKLQFFTNITHELLTPLTIISAAVEELKLTMPKGEETYQVITNNTNRLIRLIQQILEFRKAETGNLQLRVQQGDLAAFVTNNVNSFFPLMKKKRIHCSVICMPERLNGYFDSDKMDKIIYNLLSNAAKYNQAGSTVLIELTYLKESQNAALSVKDNGEGMSPDKVSQLFKRFYEGDYRKFNTIGTGIGLSLTKDLVQLHEGTITVKSEVGKGTEFIVTIPICREAFKESQIDDSATIYTAPPMEVVESSVTEEEKAKQYSLLLIEDDEELQSLMAKLLGSNYNIFTALSGKEGLNILEQENIDLVVSDIMMPEMDGIEFCKKVKSDLNTSHIPIILLTAKTREEDRVQAYESGANGFLTKPFSLSVLHAKIKNLLKDKERVNSDFKKQLVFEVKELNYTGIDEKFLSQAVECVNKYLEDPEFDQEQFAVAMNVSKSTLYRKLKSLTGLNTTGFIRNIRIKAACRIMDEKKNIRISDLAYAVGYNDPKYFAVCFKKEFGMQPSEYMEKYVAPTV